MQLNLNLRSTNRGPDLLSATFLEQSLTLSNLNFLIENNNKKVSYVYNINPFIKKSPLGCIVEMLYIVRKLIQL